MNIIEELLRIKQFRETRARAEVMTQTGKFSIASTQLEDACRQLRNHIDFAGRQENALFGDMIGRLVSVRAIEIVRAEVNVMKEQTDRLDASRELADKTVITEKTALSDARSALYKAEQNSAKFIELVRIHTDAAFKLAEKKQDQEMEEVASGHRRSDDWQGASRASEEDGI